MTTAAAEKQQNVNNIEEKHFCRLCHGTDEDDDSELCGIDQEWVQPCKCSGSIKWVHRGCFKAWHAQASYQQRTQCSICSYVFRFSKRLKPRWYAELPSRYWLLIVPAVITIIGLFYNIAISSMDFSGILIYTFAICSFLLAIIVEYVLQPGEPCYDPKCADEIAKRFEKCIETRKDLLICYPSALESGLKIEGNDKNANNDQQLPIKTARRFQIHTKSGSNLCKDCIKSGNCNNASAIWHGIWLEGSEITAEAIWHGIRLKWSEKIVDAIFASVFKKQYKKVDNIFRDRFSNISHLLKFLLTDDNNDQEIFNANGTLPLTEGAFMDDYMGKFGELWDLFILKLDLALSQKIIHEQSLPNTGNHLSLWLKSNCNLTAIAEEIKIEKCEQEVKMINDEAGYTKQYVNREFCLMDEAERKQKYYGMDLPDKNGPSQVWGGDTSKGFIPPPNKTDEDYEKWMEQTEVDYEEVYPGERNKSKHRSKRQTADEKCVKKEVDIRNIWPECKDIISIIQDQGRCNSCWVVAAAQALTDRACIFISKHRKGGNKMSYIAGRNASARDAMECTYDTVKNCSSPGGYPIDIWKYYTKHGTVNSICKPYDVDFTGAKTEWKQRCNYRCDTCPNDNGSLDLIKWGKGGKDLDKKCFIDDNFNEKTWTLTKKHSGVFYSTTDFFGSFSDEDGKNEERIMAEIVERGTIIAVYKSHNDFQGHNTKHVYKCNAGSLTGNSHAVRLIGFGQYVCPGKAPLKYWLGANSWGPGWGQSQGFFRFVRGTENECRIEKTEISWGTLTVFPYLGDDERNITKKD